MDYTFTRSATPTDWRALPRAFAEGEKVQKFTGCDYGCSTDDLRFGGVESVACTLDGETFFTVPLDMLRAE